MIKRTTRIKKKAECDDCEGRIREVLSDPNNEKILRDKNAGKIIGNYQIMHNGLKTVLGVFGPYSKVFEVNKGVHEPQEERVFAQVLPHIQQDGTIVELGAYWSFYSMWFYKEVRNAHCYMIEHVKENLAVGKKNFELNNMIGDFTLGRIGKDAIKINDFLKDKNINKVDILHSDIQGAEYEMLLGAKKCILERKISYFFISTHSQILHYRCLNFLKHHGYKIIASADFTKQTYCFDGVLVASLASIKGPGAINIALADWYTGNLLKEGVYKLCQRFPKLFVLLHSIKNMKKK